LGTGFVAEAAPRSGVCIRTVPQNNVIVRTLAIPLAAEASRTTNEDGRLILEDKLPRRLVPRLYDGSDSSGFALVENL
jgi:hypothetical protein